MNKSRTTEIAFFMALTLAMLVLVSGVAGAQSAQIQGVINGRSGATMTVQTLSLIHI